MDSEMAHIQGVFDVRNELEAALSNRTNNFQAAFSFSKTYSDAPNPALKLSDLGIVGLPLSTREAEAVKSRSRQAPFGMGERTVVDRTVRDTWEMDASLVSFANPKWDQFVSQIVSEVCQTLGVNVAASRPRAELYKLLLYETGSHFLPHVDTEKADGMFATIVIVLPSHFTGGAAHLSFGDLSKVYDCSATSQLETTVLAWYTDVTHEIKPITSGYRLALSYNLIHTTKALRPALVRHDSLTEKLSKVLLAWQDQENAPEKLLYLLDHKYSEANLRASALKGADAQRVALLDVLAKKYGFRLGLANAHCNLRGYAEDYGPRRRRGGWYSGSEDSDEDNVDFAEVEEREMTIEHFVDLDGGLIAQKLEFDEETETIPVDLADSVESGPHDGQDYEGYMGNGAGSLSRWYRRTVLVIWPTKNNYTVLYDGQTGFKHAVEDLYEEHTPEAERRLVEFVLAHRAYGPREAAGAVCISALVAGDAGLWQRAIALCAAEGAGTTVIDAEVWQEALEKWGWDTVRPSFEVMLKHDSGNKTRLDFLWSLQGEPWKAITSDEETAKARHAEMQPWVVAQVQAVLTSLKEPTVAECPALIRAAQENGGIRCLKELIVPQFITTAAEELLRELAAQVFGADFPESEEKSTVISALLSAGIRKATFFTPRKPQPSYYSYYGKPPQAPTEDRAALAKRYLQTCVVLGCPDLVGNVLEKVGDTTALQALHAQECARNVMLPVIAACAERMRTSPNSVPKAQLESLKDRAVALYFEWFVANTTTVTQLDIRALMNAVIVDGDATMFVDKVVPRLEAMQFSETGLRALIDELHTQRARFTFPEGYAGRRFDDIFNHFVDRFTCTSAPQSALGIIETLDWLRTIGTAAAWKKALKRYVELPTAKAKYAKSVLVPLAPALRQWGTKHGVLEELAFAFQGLMQTWLRLVLGPAPGANATLSSQLSALNRWTCSCLHCSEARRFLTTGPERSKTLHRIGAPTRRHVEGFLVAYARGLATYDTVRTTPQGLTITKSDALHKLLVWRIEHANGKALLKSIAPDDAQLHQLLGAEYGNILAALRGLPHPPSATQTAASVPSGSSTRATASTPVVPAHAGQAPQAGPPSSAAVPGAPIVSAAHARLAQLPQDFQLPASVAAQAGPSAPLSQVELPPNVLAALSKRIDSRSLAVPAEPSTNTGATVQSAGERPAKKRKIFPSNPDDIIDLT